MGTPLKQLLSPSREFSQLSPEARGNLVADARAWSAFGQATDRLEGLWAHADDLARAAEPIQLSLLEPLARSRARSALGPEVVSRVEQLYRALGDANRARHHLLKWLAADGSRAALERFAELAVSDPPKEPTDILEAFAPLFAQAGPELPVVFPRLLDANSSPVVLTAALDLANDLVRRRSAGRHPAAERVSRLVELLGGIVGRLGLLSERPQHYAATSEELGRMISESVGLVVALCDALAIIGDQAAIGKLLPALELPHRRVRLEAAAALARLGHESGGQALGELARDPACRQRALAYLAELGLLDLAAAGDRTPLARAEGELAAWLSEHTQYGLPPTEIALVDARRLAWPGYDEPRDCYLFRFTYRLAGKTIEGLALAGPTLQQLPTDVEGLATDDYYALAAGRETISNEIKEISADEVQTQLAEAWRTVQERLAVGGYSVLELALVGYFFGQRYFVARAMRAGQSGVVIDDGVTCEWIANGLSSEGAYWRHKGFKLLSSFNPGFRAPPDASIDAAR